MQNSVHSTRSQERFVKVDKNDLSAVAQARAIINLLYKTHSNSKGSFRGTRHNVRFRELETVLAFNYNGLLLTDDDAGHDDLRIVIDHLIAMRKNPLPFIRNWVQDWAPWCDAVRLDRMIADAIDKPRKWTADRLAKALGLDYAVRTGLDITTIGSIDRDKSQREEIQKQADVHRKRSKRRAAGAIPRSEYEAGSISRQKPWEFFGVSRSKWYKMGKPQPQSWTSVTDAIDSSIAPVRPVQKRKTKALPVSARKRPADQHEAAKPVSTGRCRIVIAASEQLEPHSACQAVNAEIRSFRKTSSA